jgi:small nuclear ribonucleoprotein (snRNP)-like protein
MPRGRLIGVDETANLVDKGIGNETIYLRGDFTVTAARDNRAILRARQSLTDRLLNRGNARVIVEYPRGTATPREGESFQRFTERPFQIVDVRRGVDGQINVYAREVTAGE